MADDHSTNPTSPPGCERFQGDIAVLVIGTLDGCERSVLLSHLEGCPVCDSLREEISETTRALEAFRPFVRAEP
jgi:hypothetical protein